jgi:transposase
MDKYIGFDIDDKKTIACVVQEGKPDMYETLPTEISFLKLWLKQQRNSGERLHLTFEVSGQAGWLHDELFDLVDTLTVSNPSKMTWIYRTAKKTDRIDARKQAVLLQLGEIPKVHMPNQEVRQWRGQIQHRRKLMGSSVQIKNRVRTLVKGRGYRQAQHGGSWWSKKNCHWLEQLATSSEHLWCDQLGDMLEQLSLYEGQIKRVTKRLDERLKIHPGAVVLMDIPGVGPRTTEAVLAYTDEIERFRRGRDYCSYFGMTRWLIVESAWRAIKKSPALKEFYERVRHGQDKRKKIAIVATARKILSIMRAKLISGEVFNEKLILHQEQLKRAQQEWEQNEKQLRSKMRNFYN